MKNKPPLSDCHQARVRLNREPKDGVTLYYICTKCGRACDLSTDNKELA